MLAASRDGLDNPIVEVGLPELHLQGIDECAAGVLLELDGELAPQVRRRLLDEAAGNPLALVELRAALSSEHLDGSIQLPAWLPLTTRLERAFAARLPTLPAGTRTLLQVAALDEAASSPNPGGGDAPARRRRHARQVGTGDSRRLLEVDARALRFRHPLVRSAVYQAMTMPQRHAAHAALAGCSRQSGSPESGIGLLQR